MGRARRGRTGCRRRWKPRCQAFRQPMKLGRKSRRISFPASMANAAAMSRRNASKDIETARKRIESGLARLNCRSVQPRSLRHHEPRDGARQPTARRGDQQEAARAAEGTDMAPVPARLHPAQPRRPRRSHPLPTGRSSISCSFRPAAARPRPILASQRFAIARRRLNNPGLRRRWAVGGDALHAAPADARSAAARGRSGLCARTGAQGEEASRRLADRDRAVGRRRGHAQQSRQMPRTGRKTPPSTGSSSTRKARARRRRR